FDAPKSKASMADDPELVKLTTDIEIEDMRTADKDPNKDAESKDDDEGWVDELYLLEEEEHKQLMDSICPLKLILAKLQKLTYKVIHLMTIILPAWKAVLEDLDLPVRIIPCDISTWWNSTYDMLDFVLTYQEGINVIT
ncbi:uncharacterized protein BJ212DRAFT_1242422, partial [Suillus subaureus]